MKHFFLIGWLCCTLSLLYAQSGWEHVITELNTDIRAMDIGANRVVIGGSEGSCESARLYIFNIVGTLLWFVDPFDDNLSRVKDVKIHDGYIWVFGEGATADDVGSPTDGFRIAAFTLNGIRAAYYEIPIPSFTQQVVEGFFLNLDPLDLDYLMLIGEKSIYWIDANTGDYTNLSLDENAWVQEGVLMEDLLIALRYDSEVKLVSLFDTSMFWSIPADDEIQAIATDGQSLWFVDGNNFWRRSPNGRLKWLGTMPVGITIQGMEHSDGELFCWGYDGDYQDIIYRYIPTQNWEVYYDPGSEIPNFRVVHKSGNRLFMTGDSGLGSYVRVINVSNWILPPSYDLALSNLGIIGEVEIDTLEGNGNWYYIQVQADLQVEVTNVGAGVVDHFVTSSWSLGNFNCQEWRLSKTANNANLGPGESFTHAFHYNNYLYISDSFNGLRVNFFVWGPNHRIDEYGSNNGMGELLITDVDRIEPNLVKLNLFPNPATDEVFLELTDEVNIGSIHITDTHGRLYQKIMPSVDQSLIRIPRNNLPAGMYFLQIETSKGLAVKKLIFQ